MVRFSSPPGTVFSSDPYLDRCRWRDPIRREVGADLPSALVVRDRGAEYGADEEASERDEPPVPDPFDDADALDELGDEIATLAAHIHAATHRLLLLVADFDRRRGWELGGHRSCAHWLAYRTRMDLGTAREKVRAARVLVGLPVIGAAMARGVLSFSAVRALTRVATPENESDLLELAQGCTTAQLERVVRAWRKGSRKEEAEWERERFLSRSFSVFPDDDGMYRVTGRLPAEVGALLMRAVEAAGDHLYRERKHRWETESPEKAARHRADAVGLLAERALAAGLGRKGSRGNGARVEGGEDDEGRAAGVSGVRGGGARDELGENGDGGATCGGGNVSASGEGRTVAASVEGGAAEAPGGETGDGREPAGVEATDQSAPCRNAAPVALPVSGTRAQRYQVVLHVDADTLSATGAPGRSELEDGTRVSAETVRRLCCDGSVVPMVHGADGSILDVGRKTRTIPGALRRALEARDRGCRFPGCGLRFNDGHHVKHWADGGETSLANCVLLCLYHHRLVHEGRWTMEWWGEGNPVFFDPRGFTHYDGRWKAPEVPEEPVRTLVEDNLRRGIDPDGVTASARWKRERDIPDEAYLGALEATAT